MMVDLIKHENQRLKEELKTLRRTIINVEPSVLVDGRFEEMMIAPINVIGIARQVLEASAAKNQSSII